MVNLIFLDQSMGVFPGQTFTKSRETIEGSKAGLLLRYLPTQGCTPAYGRQTCLSCLLALCQKGPLWIRGNGASVDFLSGTVPSHAGWKEPSMT